MDMQNTMENPTVEKKTEEVQPINLLEELKQGKNFSEMIKNLPEAAWAHNATCLCCSDGRFAPEDEKLDKAGLAGQGILLLFSLPELKTFVAEMKNNPDKPESIASHVACGAAGLAYKELQRMLANNESVDSIFSWLGINSLPETADELGQIFTKRLADEVQSNYYHMDFQDAKEHGESGIIVASINFDERYIQVGDQQFFNSASAQFGVSDNYLKTELTRLTEIAFHHGKMGKESANYNPDDYFYLLVVSDSKQAERLKKITEEVATNPDFAGKVKVEIFVKE
jgi:hypothetical protein